MNLKERQIQELMNLLDDSSKELSEKIQKDIYNDGVDTYDLMLLEWIAKSSETLYDLAYNMKLRNAISDMVSHESFSLNVYSQKRMLITEDMIKNPSKWENIDEETSKKYNLEFKTLAYSVS